MTSKPKISKERIWTVISCQCTSLEEELCSWLFFQYDTLGIENKILDNSKILLLASFAADNEKIKDISILRNHFKEIGLLDCAKTLTIKPLANEDWLTNWKIHFAPFKVSDLFFICPPWSIKKLKDKDIVELKKIIIDPGMAFGTGLHATTAFCLQAIGKYLQGPNILDVGTGSGILSIASALSLPKAKITAIDMDENSIENAQHNIELNTVTKQIKLSKSTLESFAQTNNKQFNTILSNLTAEVIIDCLPAYNKILINDGTIILAGIIEERLSLLEKSLSKYPFKIIHEQIDKGWVGLVLNKA
jgi:ribosomal protein L11 methyltransferase